MTDSPWLVIGLGNFGSEYKSTRHNVGAMVIEQVITDLGEKLTHSKKVSADVCETRIGTHRVVLATLRSYMNESGGPTSKLMNFYKIEVENLVVLHDELDLPFGEIRIKMGGGDNGHNGLKSIRASIDSGEFVRLRLGIGRPPGTIDPSDFVLKPFNFFEKSQMNDYLQFASKALSDIVSQGVDQAQNLNNGNV
jgi:peptidyl-tRNA hydrolase, PTH1 family